MTDADDDEAEETDEGEGSEDEASLAEGELTEEQVKEVREAFSTGAGDPVTLVKETLAGVAASVREEVTKRV